MNFTYTKFLENRIDFSLQNTTGNPCDIFLIDVGTNTVITQELNWVLADNIVCYISFPPRSSEFIEKVLLRCKCSDETIDAEIECTGKQKDVYIKDKIFKSSYLEKQNFYTFKEIFFDNVYEDEIVKVSPNDIVVDIGSNVGFFSVYCQMFGPKQVISVEPDVENFICLLKNVKSFDNVYCHNFAISNKTGVEPFTYSTNGSAGSHLSKYDELIQDKNCKKTNVITLTINDFFEFLKIDRIDYLKMDCEGAELDIFETIETSNLNKIKKISLEFHSNEIKEKIVEVLTNNGFTIKKYFYLHNSPEAGMLFAYKF